MSIDKVNNLRMAVRPEDLSEAVKKAAEALDLTMLRVYGAKDKLSIGSQHYRIKILKNE